MIIRTIIETDVIWIVEGEISAGMHLSQRLVIVFGMGGSGLQVLEHLRKPETLRFVDLCSCRIIDVIDPGEAR